LKEVGMSALPIEQPPSGDYRTTTPHRTVRRAAPVRQLFPHRDARRSDEDLTFPGGGDSFSGDEGRPVSSGNPGSSRTAVATLVELAVTALPPRPGASRPTAAELSLATAADEDWLASVAGATFAPAPAVAPVETPAPWSLRLTRRGRLVLVIAAALAVAGVVTGLVVAGASAAQASGPAAAHGGDARVFVQPGDTLWSIAQRTDPRADPQTIVTGIMQANHLSTAAVTVGQRIWVPRG
jgi:nucleoid-associated protein YgaU